MPKISVVLPVYNGEKYIRASIQSVLDQSLKDFELLINDDCSTDTSMTIINSFRDGRIHVFQNDTNRGIFNGINKLVRKSNSSFIHLWAQDDVMEGNCLEDSYAFHDSNDDVAFSFSSYYWIDEFSNRIKAGPNDGKRIVLEPKDSIPLFLIYGCIPGNISTVTINKGYLLKEGLFNDELAFIGDFDMWVRLSSKYNFGKISKRLVNIRNHTQQASRRDDMYLKKLRETYHLHDFQIKLLNENRKKDGKKVVKWIHQPHFALIAFSFLRRGKWKYFIDYERALAKHGNLIMIYFRTLIFLIATKTGNKFKYKSRFFNKFSEHIENFR